MKWPVKWPGWLRPPPAVGQVARQLADDARLQLGQVRTGWEWLGDARIPASRPASVQPWRGVVRASQAYRAHGHDGATSQGAADRLAAAEATRAGRIPSGPRPAPARLDAVDARADVAAELSALASRMWDAAQRGPVPARLAPEPAARPYTRPCEWCAGTGVVVVPDGVLWMWPPDPIACPACLGRQNLKSTCQACGRLAACRCDRADVVVALAVAMIGELLDVADVEAAADAQTTLTALYDRIVRVCQLTAPRQRLGGAECPVCGSRELFVEPIGSDPLEWMVVCRGPDCRCTGPGCRCGHGSDLRAGRRHRWPGRQWRRPEQQARAGHLAGQWRKAA